MNKKIYWFPVFRKVVPADYENWMEQLALEGWNVDKLGHFNSMRMTFHKSEPKKYRYVFDLNFRHSINRDYLQTYEQFGWEFVGQMSSCYVWRMEYTDVRPESFTDAESIVRRNKRFRNAVTVGLTLFLLAILASVAGIAVCAIVGRPDKILSLTMCALFTSALSGYLFWVIRKINANLDR